MKRFIVPAAFALTTVLFVGCVDEPPRKPTRKPGSHLPPLNPATTQVDPNLPPEQQPPPSAPVEPTAPPTNVKPPSPVPEPPKVTGEIPYAKPVPGKPGFVFSPYEQYKGYIDVRGFPPGTEVKDPYSGKSFLVP